MASKPELSFWQIWNMCFGFLGIQFGFALQNSNVSRIFQTLGASMDEIPMLSIAWPGPAPWSMRWASSRWRSCCTCWWRR